MESRTRRDFCSFCTVCGKELKTYTGLLGNTSHSRWMGQEEGNPTQHVVS